MNYIQRISNNKAKRNASKVSVETHKEYLNKAYKIFPQLKNKFDIEKIQTIDDSIEMQSYGIEFIIGAIYKGFLLITLALILGLFTSSVLGCMFSAIIISLTFSSLRSMAGGYHAQSFNTCTIISLTTFLISALMAQNTYQNWSNINLCILIVFCAMSGLYVLYRYAPRDTPNKPITKKEEINKFKRWSLFYLVGWSIFILICFALNWKLIVISSCFGLLLELFSVSAFGNGVYQKLERSHNKT